MKDKIDNVYRVDRTPHFEGISSFYLYFAVYLRIGSVSFRNRRVIYVSILHLRQEVHD